VLVYNAESQSGTVWNSRCQSEQCRKFRYVKDSCTRTPTQCGPIGDRIGFGTGNGKMAINSADKDVCYDVDICRRQMF